MSEKLLIQRQPILCYQWRLKSVQECILIPFNKPSTTQRYRFRVFDFAEIIAGVVKIQKYKGSVQNFSLSRLVKIAIA
jgi:hypothetical protein